MAIISKTKRRPGQPAPARSTRRRRGGSIAAEALFGDPASSPVSGSAQLAKTKRQRRLEEVVLTTWAALASGHPVECPVCTGPLTAARGCSRCGSRLS